MSNMEGIPEAPKTSLLDVIIDEYAQKKSARTSRLILSAQFDRASQVEEVRNFFEGFVDGHKAEHPISGFCVVISDKAFIHCIEAPTKLLFILLRELNKGSCPMTNPKIISFSEEIPREYKVWVLREIDMPSDEYPTPKDWLVTIFGTVKHFLELGRELSTMSDEKAIDYLKSSQSRNLTQRVPTVEKIEAFGTCDDLCSVAEWLQIYDAPVEFTLENELVWPVEPFLTY